MAVTLFLAQLLGLLLLVKGLFALVRPDLVRDVMRDMEKSRAMSHVAGAIAVFVGLLFMLAHSIWTSTIAVIVSLIVWGVLLKGIVLLFAPKAVFEALKPTTKNDSDIRGLAVVVLLLAFYLLYVGFGL